jgi:hypothetical protein
MTDATKGTFVSSNRIFTTIQALYLPLIPPTMLFV